MAEILIVDDDSQLRQSFEKLLKQEGHIVRVAASGEAGVAAVKQASPDLVIMDMRMPGMTGLEAYQHMHTIDPRLTVIIMTAYGTTEIAIEATRMGAYDYILKPFDIPEMLTLISEALETARCSRENTETQEVVPVKADQLLGSSRVMQDVYKAIGRVAATDALVLIRGESGTGKELVAQAIHKYSQRQHKPFVPINCVAIPDTLLESELFGYEKGAFTGANRSKAGRIEQAAGGTIFLDEIGDMPLNIQAKILRLLQEKQFVRLGGGNIIPTDVRILAATNRNLEKAVADGLFREDLYYRLNVVTIALPPLCEREGDVLELADNFLARLSADMEMSNPGLAKAACEFLVTHNWPGNVRELMNTLQKALIFNRGAPISRDELTQVVSLTGNRDDATERPKESFKTEIRRVLTQYAGENCFEMLMDYSGRLVVAEALEITDGNRTRAARLLGMSRPTLLARIEKYGLKTHTVIS